MTFHGCEGENLGGAVVRDGVIPLWMGIELIGHGCIIEEERSRKRRCGAGVVEIQIFAMAIICAQADKIALIADDGDESVLAEKTAQGGVGLTDLLACLDGEGDMLAMAEIEAHDGVSDPGRAPIIHEQIDALNLWQIDVEGRPGAGVVEFGAVITLAKVVDDGVVVGDIDGREFGDVGLPRPIVGGLQGEPPR